MVTPQRNSGSPSRTTRSSPQASNLGADDIIPFLYGGSPEHLSKKGNCVYLESTNRYYVNFKKFTYMFVLTDKSIEDFWKYIEEFAPNEKNRETTQRECFLPVSARPAGKTGYYLTGFGIWVHACWMLNQTASTHPSIVEVTLLLNNLNWPAGEINKYESLWSGIKIAQFNRKRGPVVPTNPLNGWMATEFQLPPAESIDSDPADSTMDSNSIIQFKGIVNVHPTKLFVHLNNLLSILNISTPAKYILEYTNLIKSTVRGMKVSQQQYQLLPHVIPTKQKGGSSATANSNVVIHAYGMVAFIYYLGIFECNQGANKLGKFIQEDVYMTSLLEQLFVNPAHGPLGAQELFDLAFENSGWLMKACDWNEQIWGSEVTIHPNPAAADLNFQLDPFDELDSTDRGSTEQKYNNSASNPTTNENVNYTQKIANAMDAQAARVELANQREKWGSDYWAQERRKNTPAKDKKPGQNDAGLKDKYDIKDEHVNDETFLLPKGERTVDKWLFAMIRRILKLPGQTADQANIFLLGEPGCGKTWSAQTTAQRLRLPYLVIQPSFIKHIYHGGAEAKISHLFRECTKYVPMIMIFDECDNYLGTRSDIGDTNRYDSDIISAMILYLGGSVYNVPGRIAIFCSNRSRNYFDPAIKSRCTFDRMKLVPHPTSDELRDIWRSIFEVHSAQENHKDFKLINGTDTRVLDELVNTATTKGFADIRNAKQVLSNAVSVLQERHANNDLLNFKECIFWVELKKFQDNETQFLLTEQMEKKSNHSSTSVNSSQQTDLSNVANNSAHSQTTNNQLTRSVISSPSLSLLSSPQQALNGSSSGHPISSTRQHSSTQLPHTQNEISTVRADPNNPNDRALHGKNPVVNIAEWELYLMDAYGNGNCAIYAAHIIATGGKRGCEKLWNTNDKSLSDPTVTVSSIRRKMCDLIQQRPDFDVIAYSPTAADLKRKTSALACNIHLLSELRDCRYIPNRTLKPGESPGPLNSSAAAGSILDIAISEYLAQKSIGSIISNVSHSHSVPHLPQGADVNTPIGWVLFCASNGTVFNHYQVLMAKHRLSGEHKYKFTRAEIIQYKTSYSVFSDSDECRIKLAAISALAKRENNTLHALGNQHVSTDPIASDSDNSDDSDGDTISSESDNRNRKHDLETYLTEWLHLASDLRDAQVFLQGGTIKTTAVLGAVNTKSQPAPVTLEEAFNRCELTASNIPIRSNIGTLNASQFMQKIRDFLKQQQQQQQPHFYIRKTKVFVSRWLMIAHSLDYPQINTIQDDTTLVVAEILSMGTDALEMELGQTSSAIEAIEEARVYQAYENIMHYLSDSANLLSIIQDPSQYTPLSHNITLSTTAEVPAQSLGSSSTGDDFNETLLPLLIEFGNAVQNTFSSWDAKRFLQQFNQFMRLSKITISTASKVQLLTVQLTVAEGLLKFVQSIQTNSSMHEFWMFIHGRFNQQLQIPQIVIEKNFVFCYIELTKGSAAIKDAFLKIVHTIARLFNILPPTQMEPSFNTNDVEKRLSMDLESCIRQNEHKKTNFIFNLIDFKQSMRRFLFQLRDQADDRTLKIKLHTCKWLIYNTPVANYLDVLVDRNGRWYNPEATISDNLFKQFTSDTSSSYSDADELEFLLLAFEKKLYSELSGLCIAFIDAVAENYSPGGANYTQPPFSISSNPATASSSSSAIPPISVGPDFDMNSAPERITDIQDVEMGQDSFGSILDEAIDCTGSDEEYNEFDVPDESDEENDEFDVTELETNASSDPRKRPYPPYIQELWIRKEQNCPNCAYHNWGPENITTTCHAGQWEQKLAYIGRHMGGTFRNFFSDRYVPCTETNKIKLGDMFRSYTKLSPKEKKKFSKSMSSIDAADRPRWSIRNNHHRDLGLAVMHHCFCLDYQSRVIKFIFIKTK